MEESETKSRSGVLSVVLPTTSLYIFYACGDGGGSNARTKARTYFIQKINTLDSNHMPYKIQTIVNINIV